MNEPRPPGVLAQRTIPSLDGLRAISILLVIGAHASAVRGLGGGPEIVHRLGPLGVRVFFVISGFLITTLLVGEMDRTGRIDLKRFYFRRTLRIFPAYYVYLGAVLVLSAAGWLTCPPTARWLPALTYTSNFVETQWWMTGHSWSLAAEEQFYVVWPVALFALGRRRGLLAALGAVAVSPVVRVAIFLVTRSGNLTAAWQFDYMAAGSALALGAPLLANRAWWRRIVHAPSWLALLTAILVVLVHRVVSGSIRWVFAADVIVWRPIEACALALIVAWCVANSEGRVGRALAARPVRALGVLSYSLYLWQQLFLHEGAPITGPAALVASLGAAVASYVLVERPSLALRHALERRWWSARPGGTSAPSRHAGLERASAPDLSRPSDDQVAVSL